MKSLRLYILKAQLQPLVLWCCCVTAVPDDQVMIFDQILQVPFLDASIQDHRDGVGVSGCQVLSLVQQNRC